MTTTDSIAFLGDPHGDFSAFRSFRNAAPEYFPAAFVFTGDFDPERTVHEEVADVVNGRAPTYFIHGNHDTDRPEWHDRVFDEASSEMNITGRVVTVDGLRIAGLGGVFREEIWHPKNGEGRRNFLTREEFLNARPKQTWRGGIPIKHRSTIFPEDYEALADLEADVLVTHEAPSWHEYGFEEIDLLAECMGASLIVHGHLHKEFRGRLDNGIEVISLPKAGLTLVPLAEIHALKSGSPKL
jgi:Icc-related predicted phosphoesterase